MASDIKAEPNTAWWPSKERIEKARVSVFTNWLQVSKGISFKDYDELWQWSVKNPEVFWTALIEHFKLPIEGHLSPVLTERKMPGARWFPLARTNYVSQIFRNSTEAYPAIIFRNELGAVDEVSWTRLEQEVASLAGWLRSKGVGTGDRVVGYLPNIPQTVVAFLATASLGAIWSLCSPEMGIAPVLDRFRQIQPKVLIAVDGYTWSGKPYDKREVLQEMLEHLPSIEHMVLVPYLDKLTNATSSKKSVPWSETMKRNEKLQIDLQPFDHPLWVAYSSGTTGLPKPIVHGHGGILLEHVKSMAFHNDVHLGDRFHWYSTTGWLMWNISVGSLLVGGTMCVYDGNPAWPDYSTLWKFCEAVDLDIFGAGAAFYAMCEKNDIEPRMHSTFRKLRTIGSTGSPLSLDSYRWIYKNISNDVWLAPMSGGTDIASAFVGGIPILPVIPGEMQVRCLGVNVQAWDAAGQPQVGTVGELVCVDSIPSMPIYFWNDADGSRYKESYFDTYPNIWRHGDWLCITERGGAIVYGRSDSTINRHGVRMGTSEIYGVVEAFPEILDSLVVDIEYLGGESYMPLFVVLKPGYHFNAGLSEQIKDRIRSALSARHVPNEVIEVEAVPRTLTGKKLEVPVKRLLLGHSPEVVASRGAMSNPESLDWYTAFAKRRVDARSNSVA